MKSKHQFTQCTGFEWDEFNADKIWNKHQVSKMESEQLFYNHPLLLMDDTKHSELEKRFYVLGHSDSGRLLFLVFTIRSNKIRVISARDMNRNERKVYQSHEENDTGI